MSESSEGYIHISSNGHYFIDGNEKPFFWLGDTAWPLLTSFSQEDADFYFETRCRQGFTVIQSVIGWTGGTLDPFALMPNIDGHYAWIDGDVSKPDEEYFENVDKMVGLAEQKGLVLALLPLWGYFAEKYPVIDRDRAYIYGMWLGERYRGCKNIIWINGGDCKTWDSPVWEGLASGLKEGCLDKHLVTFHPGGESGISSNEFHHRKWLDFNMIQTWSNHSGIYQFIRFDYSAVPAKPVVLGEGAYEDGPEYPTGPITPYIIRKQAYWTFMAGGFHTYGNNFMWRPGVLWRKHLDSTGAQHMSIFKSIVTSKEWWGLMPDTSVFVRGINGGDNFNAAMSSVYGNLIMAYISSNTTVVLSLEAITNSSLVLSTWINPSTGEKLEAGTCLNTEKLSLKTPAGWEDAVLIFTGIV